MDKTATIEMSFEEMIDILKGLVFGAQAFERLTSREREALNKAINILEK